MEFAANDAMVAPLGLSVADVAAAKGARPMFTKCAQGLAASRRLVRVRSYTSAQRATATPARRHRPAPGRRSNDPAYECMYPG
eukprot:COSAG02_NODE_5100_length_4629_cov_87.536424_1_plen_83_part_00